MINNPTKLDLYLYTVHEYIMYLTLSLSAGNLRECRGTKLKSFLFGVSDFNLRNQKRKRECKEPTFKTP